MAQAQLQPGQVFAGYTIERLLGAGGMGAVYLARHPNLPKLVALKLLTRAMTDDDDVRARFLREADHIARLDHPNIVAVYDRGDQDGQLWIAMQCIDGSDAAAVIRGGPMPAARAVRIVSETAKALDFAHARDVLHRDVKPANMSPGNHSTGPRDPPAPATPHVANPSRRPSPCPTRPHPDLGTNSRSTAPT
jgi:serine/threonine protein kinase